jgi:hypothetical protein
LSRMPPRGAAGWPVAGAPDAGASVAGAGAAGAAAPSVAGAAGVVADDDAGTVELSNTEPVGETFLPTSDNEMLDAKNAKANAAVIRVSKFAWPRPVKNPPPPPPPIPSAPPSDFCSSTTPTSEAAIMRWITSSTVCIGNTVHLA